MDAVRKERGEGYVQGGKRYEIEEKREEKGVYSEVHVRGMRLKRRERRRVCTIQEGN